MALPVRLSRGRQQADPGGFARNDFNTMLSRLFTSGLMAEVDESALAPVLNYGVDIREDADHFIVEADLPGFRKEDVDISLENGTLTIVAEKREERDEPATGAQGQQAQGKAGQPGQAGQQAGQGQQQQQQAGRAAQRNEGDYLLHERRIQRVVRSFTLPPNVDESNVQASMENGVLRIVLNKREESKPKKIQVS